jgi:hypothetical protein
MIPFGNTEKKETLRRDVALSPHKSKTPPRSGLAVFFFRWSADRLGEVWRRRWRSS